MEDEVTYLMVTPNFYLFIFSLFDGVNQFWLFCRSNLLDNIVLESLTFFIL